MSIKEVKRVAVKAPAKTTSAATANAKGVGAGAPKGVVRPEEFAAALAGAVRGERPIPDWAGKRLYASPEAKAYWEGRADGASSLSSFAKLIGENRELLQAIDQGGAMSVADIARSVGRAQPNVSRSLSKLEDYGVVSVRQGIGRKKQVQISSRRMHFEVDLLSGEVTLVAASERMRGSETRAPVKHDEQRKGRRAVAMSGGADKPSAPQVDARTKTRRRPGTDKAGKK